jgi:hypothetical protein
MLTTELITKVKENLNITGEEKDLIIADMIQEVLNYCNLTEAPAELEPFIRKKVKGIIDYEAENGTASVFDVKSIKEGDSSITFNVDEKTSKETIYGLSDRDKASLRGFRRLRK